MKKIALVVPGGVDRSGEYRVIPALVALIRRLAARVDLRVFALRHEPHPASWQLAGARIVNVGGGFNTARAVAAIAREHRAGAFDLIHCVWAGRVGLVGVMSARLLGVPCAVHVAGGELAALPEIRYGGWLHFHGRVRERLVMKGAAAMSAASAPLVERLAALGAGAERIPLGVALDEWPPAAPRARDGAVARLIHVASLNAVKDQHTLLRAMAALRGAGVPFSLDVVGEDTLRGVVQAEAARLALGDSVRFHGFLTQRQLRPVMEAAHLHLVSSRHEAGPLVVLEAAVAGVPTVGTRVGHIAEWSPDAALAVPVGDAAALALAVRSLLDDEDRRLRLARAAQARALAEDADFTAEQFLRLYERLMRR